MPKARCIVANLKQKARLEVRLNSRNKSLIEKAAAYRGQTLSSFTISTLVEEARKVVESHGKIRLSDRDRDTFLALLEKPPEPNARLIRTAKRYSRSVRP